MSNFIKIARDDFQLGAIKDIGHGSFSVGFPTSHATKKGEVTTGYIDEKTTGVAHSDLVKAMQKLGIYVARALGVTVIISNLAKGLQDSGAKVKATKEHGSSAEKALLENILVTGLKISTNDHGEMSGCTIISKVTSFHNKVISVSTPHISLLGTDLGFEGDLESAINNLEDECYEYVTGNKKGVIDMFDNVPEAKVEEKVEEEELDAVPA